MVLYPPRGLIFKLLDNIILFMFDVVNVKGLSYSYDDIKVLEDIDIDIKNGEFIGIIGANGSGKSTFVKHLNALLKGNGDVKVFGVSPNKKIREKVGMVFQNPDNQFVSSIVYEDLSFGPSNLKVDEEEIKARIKEALDKVGMKEYENRSTYLLSGGEKQKIALAGVLVMYPEIIIFDEVTSMLDYKGKNEILNLIYKLHEDGKTIIMLSHNVEECLKCNRLLLINNGRVIAYDDTRKIISNKDLLISNGVDVPLTVKLYYDLLDKGIKLSFCPLNNEEFLEALCHLN